MSIENVFLHEEYVPLKVIVKEKRALIEAFRHLENILSECAYRKRTDSYAKKKKSLFDSIFAGFSTYSIADNKCSYQVSHEGAAFHFFSLDIINHFIKAAKNLYYNCQT